MKILTPIELLKEEYETHKRSLAKSEELYFNQKITKDLNNTHRENLIPVIASYKEAIQLLEKHERTSRNQDQD